MLCAAQSLGVPLRTRDFLEERASVGPGMPEYWADSEYWGEAVMAVVT